MGTTNFRVWGSDPASENTFVSQADFETNNTQRKTGFQPSIIASSSYTNSGLREGTLFATAFMQMIEDSGIDTSNIHFDSTVAALQSVLESFTKRYRHNINITDNTGLEIHICVISQKSSQYTTMNEIKSILHSAYNNEIIAYGKTNSNYAITDIIIPNIGTNINYGYIDNDGTKTRNVIVFNALSLSDVVSVL